MTNQYEGFKDLPAFTGKVRAPARASVTVPRPEIALAGDASVEVFQAAYRRGLNPIDAQELLTRNFPPRATILSPWLPEKGLAMIHGPRGLGKTHMSLNVAYAVASGGSFLGWQAQAPRRVVFIDGEMQASQLQERFAHIVASAEKELLEPSYFRLVASDLEADGLPNLADEDAQRFFDEAIKNADVVILDNLSTLVRGAKENEADGWQPVQNWLLKLKRDGKSVLLIHHAGKGGGQRGTSRKEDVLDTVIGLRRPPDYSPEQGARFEVHFEKSRGFFGRDAEPFEAQLIDGVWRTGPLTVADDDESLRAMQASGMSFRDIEKRTGLSKSAVGRKLKREDS